jgi:hypothetical protein
VAAGLWLWHQVKADRPSEEKTPAPKRRRCIASTAHFIVAANIERLIDIIQKAERSPEESIIVIVACLNNFMLQNASNASLEI